eukprot:scaffold233438_cov24-Attheya_sp.AAC.1
MPLALPFTDSFFTIQVRCISSSSFKNKIQSDDSFAKVGRIGKFSTFIDTNVYGILAHGA